MPFRRGGRAVLLLRARHAGERGQLALPIDANPTGPRDLDFQMVDASLVLRQMEGAGTKLNLVLLDACRNNPFAIRGIRASGGGLAEMQAPEGTLISYATQPGNVAADGAGQNSPYTAAVVNAMRQPGQDIFRVFNEVGLTVKRATGGRSSPGSPRRPSRGRSISSIMVQSRSPCRKCRRRGRQPHPRRHRPDTTACG